MNKDEPARDPGVRAPRPWWMEFVLHFATFGVYSMFWLVARVRELRMLTGRRLRPWLWLPVPLLMPAQLVAIPRFVKGWDAVGAPLGQGRWSKWTIPITLAMALLSTAVPMHNVFPEVVGLEAFLLVWLLCWAGLFSGLDARVNRIKRYVANVEFSGKGRAYTVPEWTLLACFSPLTLLVIAAWAIDDLIYGVVEDLPADSRYADVNGAFSFPVVGRGWRSVEVGKYSNGDAALEIEGAGSTMYFLVFEHGRGVAINDVVSQRMAESRDQLAGGSCNESRSFVRNQPIVVSYTECRGRLLGDPSMQTVTVFEVDGSAYEMLGWLSVPLASFDRLAVDFRQVARGFEPL
ncbi:MAG: hypothetical protein OXI79_10475 [Gammaproteobacteria bacterium]|nr:hypothetical protein [Gammaproteobacteria bacterium]